MSRRVVWLQLLIGWLPLWALFTTLVLTNHPNVQFGAAAFISLRMIVAAAILGLGVQRITERIPWPNPVRPGFVLLHLAAAFGYSIAWVILNSLIESVLRGAVLLVIGVSMSSFIAVGVWLYVMIAGVSYTLQSNARTARAETTAAQAQLAALRSQLNPHFLFNALHTVVQLIPRQPEVASQAAEQVAGLLRTTLEEDRDVITLRTRARFRHSISGGRANPVRRPASSAVQYIGRIACRHASLVCRADTGRERGTPRRREEGRAD